MTAWSIAKWPVLVLLVTTMIAILYRAAPNAKGRGFRCITPGSFLALLIWMIVSAGFALSPRPPDAGRGSADRA